MNTGITFKEIESAIKSLGPPPPEKTFYLSKAWFDLFLNTAEEVRFPQPISGIEVKMAPWLPMISFYHACDLQTKREIIVEEQTHCVVMEKQPKLPLGKWYFNNQGSLEWSTGRSITNHLNHE